MFRSIWKKQVVVCACLLCGGFVGSTALAGPVPPHPPSEISGEYTANTLGSQSQQFPLNFTLSGGVVAGPLPDFAGFTPPDLGVSFDLTGGVLTLTDQVTSSSDFNLSGGASGNILYNINLPRLVGPFEINAVLTLAPTPPPNNTTGVSLIFLNPSLLSITFPPDVNLEPSWGPDVTPVFFDITPIPEPASIVHLTWVGLLGVIGFFRRQRRAVAA
jgi:hypothetical protein